MALGFQVREKVVEALALVGVAAVSVMQRLECGLVGVVFAHDVEMANSFYHTDDSHGHSVVGVESQCDRFHFFLELCCKTNCFF